MTLADNFSGLPICLSLIGEIADNYRIIF